VQRPASAVHEEVLDWRPFAYSTLRSTIPRGMGFVSTTAFEPTESGTHVVILIQKASSARERAAMEAMGPMPLEMYRLSLDRLKDVVASDVAESDVAAPAP
jgi:hypothetical protein